MAKKRAKKSPAKTSAQAPDPVKAPEMVPGPNGGSLRVGNPGNVGGSGRPPSWLREQLRGDFADRMHIAGSIADGKPMAKARFPVAALIDYVVCANCGESQVRPKDADSALAEVNVEVSASPKDRLGALDLMAKYGLGTLKEVSVENVRERVVATLSVIRRHCSAEQAETIIAELRPLWA